MTPRLLPLVTLLTLLACGGGGEKKGEANSIAKALEPSKVEEKADDIKVKPREKDPTALENPWTFEDVRTNLVPGTQLVYKRSGTDAKGKKVDDELTLLLRMNTDDGAGTSYTVEPDQGNNDASSMVATSPWGKLSPFFSMEKPKEEVVAREMVEVPAGKFDSCAKMELSDFFGNKRTVWMIPGKPGIYAKVVDHGNEADEKDETEIVQELLSIGQIEGK
jgi:hypothetical protein